MASHTTRAPAERTRWGFAAIYGAVAALVIGVLIVAFVWTAATSQAQNLPVGVSGPADRVAALEDALAEQDPAPFDLIAVDSRDDAVTQIENRTLYGAILLDEPEVLLASAASNASAQALRGVATQLQVQISATAQAALVAQVQKLAAALAAAPSAAVPPAGAGTETPPAHSSAASPPEIPEVVVIDVVPLAETDPNGAGLTAASFPLTLGGMLGGILLSTLVAGAIRRLLGLVVLGVSAGVVGTVILQTWLGLLEGEWLLNAAALGLALAATAAFITGMNAVFGPAGIGIGAVITVLISNPLAGAAAPWEFLPQPWGAIGQFFVPGAGTRLIRSLSYFPAAPTEQQWAILAAWTALGVVLTVIGHFRSRADLRVPAGQLQAVPAH